MLPSPRLAPAPATQVGLELEGRELIARFELRDRDDGCWWQLESVKGKEAGQWQLLPISHP